MIKKYVLFVLALLWVHGCTSKEDYILFHESNMNSKTDINNSQQVVEFENIQFEYKIVPNDRVSVIVYDHPEFSTSSLEMRVQDKGILVNSQGEVRLPLIKSVEIAGLTQTEALNKVENLYERYIKSPDIYLEVVNKKAYVIGEVEKPGEIELNNERVTLLQALAKAGDLADTADRKLILILRSNSKGIKKEVVDLTNINTITATNMFIRPNDIIYVTPNDMKTLNVNISQIDPMFRLLSDVLSPFVNIKYLSK